MTIAHANSAYDGMTYDVDDSVTVSKNGAPSTNGWGVPEVIRSHLLWSTEL